VYYPAKWRLAPAEEMVNVYGFDVGEEMIRIISEEIQKEINEEIERTPVTQETIDFLTGADKKVTEPIPIVEFEMEKSYIGTPQDRKKWEKENGKKSRR